MVDETQTTATETTTETTETPSADQTNSSTQAEAKVDLSAEQTEETTEAEDTRTDEERAADEKAEAERAELFGAPEGDEAYAVEGLPEGMGIDAAALEAITPVAKQLGLSNKGLSSIAQVYAEKVLPGVMERATASIEQNVIAQRTQWEQDAEAAIKANGQDLKNKAGEVLSFDAQPKATVLKTAAKALDQLAPAGFREFLADTGLAQHPMMVAFAYQAGKSIAEETEIETHDTGSKKARSQVERFYGPQG